MPLPYYRPPTEPEAEPEPARTAMLEEESVNEWRHRMLFEAGWLEPYATVLAADHSIDLHLACDLITTRGCDPATAWEILT